MDGTHEIAQHLWNRNKNVRSDCLKVLYEIGYIDPALIAPYAEDFLKLLQEKNNRLVWGAMIGLSTVADRRADAVWPWIDDVMETINHGTVITVVWGVKTLAITRYSTCTNSLETSNYRTARQAFSKEPSIQRGGRESQRARRRCSRQSSAAAGRAVRWRLDNILEMQTVDNQRPPELFCRNLLNNLIEAWMQSILTADQADGLNPKIPGLPPATPAQSH